MGVFEDLVIIDEAANAHIRVRVQREVNLLWKKRGCRNYHGCSNKVPEGSEQTRIGHRINRVRMRRSELSLVQKERSSK